MKLHIYQKGKGSHVNIIMLVDIKKNSLTYIVSI